MFERVIANLLNQYVGKYIQNLDSSNLNVSILQGDVELTDLQLRPEALVELDLPIEVKAGYVGRLKIDIPWSNLFTADVHVFLDELYILAGPITDRQYDAQRERSLANATKRQKLQALQSSSLADVAAKSDEDAGFYEKLSTNLLNRLQISIRNIHIRYEDTVTNVDHPFACGIMLKQILIRTTNSKWEATAQPSSSNMMHKLMRLEDLSVYWNPYIPEQHLIRSRLNTDGWRNLLRMSIDSHSIFEEDFDFIIEPATAQVQLILSGDSNFSLPKIFANFTLEEIEVLLSRQQFLNLLSLSESFEMMRVNQRYRKYHPNVPLRISPRSWWHYAYAAVLEEFIRPFSWERIKEHRAQYRKYKNLFKKSLEQSDHESIQSKLTEMEEHLDIANILIAREQAKLEFTQEAPERAKKKKREKGWWASWFGGSDDEDDMEVEIMGKDKDWLVRLNEEEKEKLYNGIGYDENTKAMVYPKQYVAYKVQLILKSCCLSLVNYSKKILQVSVTHLLTTVEHRPGAGAFRLSSNTESFSIEGASIEHELIPILTSDIGVYAPAVNQVFTLDFETKPLYVDADYSLNLNMQPVEIVYDEHSLSEVTAFFQVPHGGVDIKTAAMATLEEMAKYSRAGLQYAIEQHKSLHVAVNMRSPYIVVPEFGTLHRGGNVLIADFGTLRVESELQPKDVSLEDATMSEIESRLYDQFTVTVSEVKVLLADSGDDWHTAQTQPDSEYHILPNVRVVLAFFTAVTRDFKQLPQQKLVANVPTLKLNISDKRLLLLTSFLKNFPVPTSTSMVTLGEDAVDGGPLPPPPPVLLDLTEAQCEPDLGSLRKMRRSILGRRVIDRSRPIIIIDKAPYCRRDSADDEDSYYSASDHSDEDVDEWSEFVSIKAVDDNSSISNSIKVLARLTLGEFVINMSKVMDRHEAPYLMFRVDRLQVDAALTVHGYALHATLGGLQLVDKIHVGSSGEYMEILNTQSNTDLVSITYRKVDPECPDFGTLYNHTEHAVVLKFHAMAALFDQASMIYLSTFISGIITSVQTMDLKTSTSSVVSIMEPVYRDRASFVERLTSITEQVDSQQPHMSKVNLVAEVQNVRITLSDSDSVLAEVCIRGLETHILSKSSRSMVRCRLKDLSVIDKSVGAVFPKMLMIENDNLFDLKFVKFNKSSEMSRRDNKHRQGLDYSLRVRVGHLQGVLLGKFYWEVTRFFEPFINPEMTEAAKTAARETVQKRVEDIQSQNLRVSLHLDLRTPTVLVPPNSGSNKMFILRLGDLSLSNVFDFTAASPDARQEWNHLYLNLRSVRIERGTLSLTDDSLEVLHQVMEPVCFKADMRLAMRPIVSDVKYDISGELDKINLRLFRKDFQLLRATLAQNWTEGSPQPTSGIYESPTVQNLHLPLESGLGALTPVEEESESLTDAIPPPSPPAQKLSTTILLRFAGISALLCENEASTVKGPSSLCLMSLDKLNLSCTQHSDGDLKVNFALQTVAIDDARPNSKLAHKRILYFSEKQDASDKLPLVSLIYKVSSDGNQKADLMVETLRLNLSVPFVLSLLEFLQPALADPKDSVDSAATLTPSAGPPPAPPLASSASTLSVYGTFKQPEVVLLADPTVVDSRAIILYSSIAFEYRVEVEKQVFWSKVSDLKMVSTNVGFSHHTASSSTILAPCSVELKQTSESGVMDVTVSISKVDIFLSATVLNTIQDIVFAIKLPTPKPEPSAGKSKLSDSKNLWKVSKVTAERWLKQDNEPPVSLQAQLTAREVKQTLQLDIGEVSAMFEVENLDYHIPILCLRTSLSAKLVNWSSLMNLDLELAVDVLFYNERLSTWEPLVEPVQETEGVFRPWGVYIKMARGQSFPMACTYEDRELDVPDGLQSEVQQLMHKSRTRSSSSETDTDSSTDMTVIRQKSVRKIRHSSDRSYDSLSHHSSMQGESDSEPEGFINNITNKLGSIFSSDSSDADVSETDDNDDIFDPSLDKPVFITSRGPVGVSTGIQGMDEIDGGPEEEEARETCLYIVIDSHDILRLNVTPQAISVLQNVTEAMTSPASSELCTVRNLPAFEISNKLGIPVYITLHPGIKIHKDRLYQCTVFRAGENKENIRPYACDTDDEGIENIDEESKPTSKDESDGLGVVERMLANAGHMLTSAGAFVFDDDDDYLSGEKLDRHRLRLQVEGFELLPSILHQRACHRLLPLSPKKNGTMYCVVMDVDMLHGRKVVSITSPLQLENQLTMTVDVWCRTEELKRHATTAALATGPGDLSKLTTLAPQDSFNLPLMVAFHCSLFIGPTDINYEPSSQGVWWQDVLQSKDRCKYFVSQSLQEEKKAFYFKVLCKEGQKLEPPQQLVSRKIPYFVLSLHPPVTIHNYLPYDVQFSLQESSASTSLTHGESTPLYTVDLRKSYKLLLGISDYLGCDWSGSLEIAPGMEIFKAIMMETDMDLDNVNKHLSLSIHANQGNSLDLFIYSPYWIINKTELQLQLRGSMADAMFECGPATNPLLFRFKKHKRKKAKLRIYESKWSPSFSMDTVGSSGVVVCNERERNRKFMFMVQSQLSKLKLTKIITILPLFLVVNRCSHKLRYMEENEDADLWFDLAQGECQPFWPATESYAMFVRYDSSTVVSQHFPMRTPHSTVLRMDRGTALCVEVSGGTNTPTTITFTDYEDGSAPVRIINLCEDVFIKVHQKNQSQVSLLSGGQSLLYTWDEPVAERTLMWNVYGLKKPSSPAYISKDGSDSVQLRVQSLTAAGVLDVSDKTDPQGSSPEDDSDETDGLLVGRDKTLIGRTRTDKMVIFWVSYLDGLQRTLLFTQDERIALAVKRAHVQSVDLPLHRGSIKMNEGEQTTMACFLSLEGVMVSVINAAYEEVALLTVGSSPATWEVEVNGRWKLLNVELATWLEDQWHNHKPFASLQDQIEADLIKMQMSKPFIGALRRTHSPGMWAQYRSSLHHTSLHARVQRLQIDNQLCDAYFPSVLYPAPIPSYILRRASRKPFIEIGVMRRTVKESDCDTFRYVKLLIQKFNLHVDKGFLLSLNDVFSSMQKTEAESHQLHADLLVAQKSLQELAAVMVASRPQKIYFEYFHLSPLKLSISFSLNGTAHLADSRPPSVTGDIIDFFLTSVGATLTEIKDVELRMAYFERKGVVVSREQLLQQVQSHYSHQALQQAYVLILGLDVLGNPYGLVRDFTQGLGDFFYEPFLGSIQGSDEFAEGLARGVESLLGNTVGGAAGSVALVTGSVGSVLAAMSFDEEYRRQRRTRMSQHPRHLPASLAEAAKNLLMGVCLGFSGIVLDPVKGAHEDGVEGFFRGVGKGIMGLLTKPAGGVADMVSMAFDGVRRAAEMETGVVARARLPRFINPYMGLRPYSEWKATGKRLLQSIKKGEFAVIDTYWAHAPLSQGERSDILLITDKQLMLLERQRFWGQWDVDWRISIDSILGVPAILGDKLVFKVKQDESASLNLFASSEREVTCAQRDVLEWLQKQVENVIKYRQQ